jgi:hypothetical protein
VWPSLQKRLFLSSSSLSPGPKNPERTEVKKRRLHLLFPFDEHGHRVPT